WIYAHDSKTGIIFIIADSLEMSTSVMKGRLKYIKDAFYQSFIVDNNNLSNWDGDAEKFRNFNEVIKDYYQQWIKAEKSSNLADFFEIIGILQEILLFSKKIIEKYGNEEQQKSIYSKIEEFLAYIKKQTDENNIQEINKLLFSRDTDFSVININPDNCDTDFVKDTIKNIIENIFKNIKNEFGFNKSLDLFNEEGVFKYIITNYILIKNSNLDNFILKLFLE
ncbi:MAG: hypothetical protein ACFFAO_15505, partial [Candidatus Hermodarchaeota archaeon]